MIVNLRTITHKLMNRSSLNNACYIFKLIRKISIIIFIANKSNVLNFRLTFISKIFVDCHLD